MSSNTQLDWSWWIFGSAISLQYHYWNILSSNNNSIVNVSPMHKNAPFFFAFYWYNQCDQCLDYYGERGGLKLLNNQFKTLDTTESTYCIKLFTKDKLQLTFAR